MSDKTVGSHCHLQIVFLFLQVILDGKDTSFQGGLVE